MTETCPGKRLNGKGERGLQDLVQSGSNSKATREIKGKCIGAGRLKRPRIHSHTHNPSTRLYLYSSVQGMKRKKEKKKKT